jgi:hypothetical protein
MREVARSTSGMAMSRTNWQNEPAREIAYRKLHERIASQDSCITFLLMELRALQKRVAKLEKSNEATTYAKLRTARHLAEIRELEQCNNLPEGQAGDPTVGHPPVNTGL